MVPINLRAEFAEYMQACYAGQTLPPSQLREVEQAFLSGMHVLNEVVAVQGAAYGTPWLRAALRQRLVEIGCFRSVSG